MRNLILKSGLRWVWLSALVILIDRITKISALRLLEPYSPLPILPSFNLTLAYNKGAAFSFLDAASGWQMWVLGAIAVIVSVIIIIWMKRLPASKRWLCIAIALILGGALGNLWDRLSYGHVIDFLEVYVSHFYWPAFNVADSAICVGAVMLFFDALFKKCDG